MWEAPPAAIRRASHRRSVCGRRGEYLHLCIHLVGGGGDAVRSGARESVAGHSCVNQQRAFSWRVRCVFLRYQFSQ
jgi:hypothetical protein